MTLFHSGRNKLMKKSSSTRKPFGEQGLNEVLEAIDYMKRAARLEERRSRLLKIIYFLKNEAYQEWYVGDLPNVNGRFVWLRSLYRKRQERDKSLDSFVVRHFRRLRFKYNAIVFKRKRYMDSLQYIKVRYPRMYSKAIAKIAKRYKEYCVKNGLTNEAYFTRKVRGEDYKQFWAGLYELFGNVCSKRTLEKIWFFLYRARLFIFGIKYSSFFIYWNDIGIFFIYVAVSLFCYFVFAALLSKVAKSVTTKDDFCVYKKNQVFFDYDRGGLIFYGITGFFFILISFFLFLVFYPAFIWLNLIPDGLIGYNFVRFWIYYITVCNGILAWYFFNNLRPYYFTGAQKIFWYFVVLGCVVFVFWGVSLFVYIIFCFFLAFFLSGKPIYSNVEGQEYKNKGFDITHDKRDVRTKSGSKNITAIVTNMSRSRRR